MHSAAAMGSGRMIARRGAGYTLVEAMVIVMIIAVSSVVFVPGFTRAVVDQRVSSATRELIRIGRRARSDTLGYLRAHLLWIQPTRDGSAGRIQLLRGNINSCRLEQWATLHTQCSSSPVGAACLEDFRLSDRAWGEGSIALFEERLVGGAASYQRNLRALCFGPNGVMYHGTGANLAAAVTALSETNDMDGGFVYTLHTGSATPLTTDRVHRVLFPLGATPRSLR